MVLRWKRRHGAVSRSVRFRVGHTLACVRGIPG
jgi:hypothetical protein